MINNICLNNDCIVDTYRIFFETQGRKHGCNSSWSWLNDKLILYGRFSLTVRYSYYSNVFSNKYVQNLFSEQLFIYF